MILHTLCESVFSLRNRIGKIPFPYPINTIPGQLTAKPVYAPLRSALNEHPLDVQRRLPGLSHKKKMDANQFFLTNIHLHPDISIILFTSFYLFSDRLNLCSRRSVPPVLRFPLDFGPR